jgi:hypothetical protein
MVSKTPIPQKSPIDCRVSLEAKQSEPNPTTVESPQKKIPFPTPFQTLAKSPPLLLKAKIRWML